MSELLVDHKLPTETDHQQSNRGYEENVDGRTHRKAVPQPQNPQNDQYDSYQPQHMNLLFDEPFPLPVITSSYPPAMGSYTSGYGITMPAGSDHTVNDQNSFLLDEPDHDYATAKDMPIVEKN